MPKRIVYNRTPGPSVALVIQSQAVEDKKGSWWVRYRISGKDWCKWAPYANIGKPTMLEEPGTIISVTLPNDKD